MKNVLAIIGITLCTSLGVLAGASVAESVNELRAQVNQVAVEVAEGDEAGAVAAAEQAYQTWLSLPPAVRRASHAPRWPPDVCRQACPQQAGTQ